jgi:hypothetical protein
VEQLEEIVQVVELGVEEVEKLKSMSWATTNLYLRNIGKKQ